MTGSEPQLSSHGRLILAAVVGVLFVGSIVVTVVAWNDASLGTRAALVLGIVSLFFTFSATLIPVVTYRQHIIRKPPSAAESVPHED